MSRRREYVPWMLFASVNKINELLFALSRLDTNLLLLATASICTKK